MKAKKVAPKKPVNKLFPGRPDYTGPQRGCFAFVHHGMLFENASEDIQNRVQYVRQMKPPKEVRIRLQHILLLNKALTERIQEFNNKNARLYGNYNNQARHDKDIKAAVLRYVRRHIKPLRWNGSSLTFASGAEMTG